MAKTQNDNPLFFRILTAYYFSKIASMMRTNIKTHDRGTIPVSLYAINLSVSGTGKGHSTNIMEEQVIHKFKKNFLNNTFEEVAKKNLAKLANFRATKYADDPDETLERVEKEFDLLGPLLFSFDSGTTPAVKQMRHKLLMANAGSMNFECDEIGNNIASINELLTTFLELYDVGKVKQKLIKNTTENRRNEEIEGKTPTNMLLFGTPNKVLNGSKEEETFISMLDTGYARRCLFGLQTKSNGFKDMSASDLYDIMTDTSSVDYLDAISNHFGNLADILNFNITLTMTKDVSLHIIEYKTHCTKIAYDLGDHEDILRTEIEHRYYKALKLAGAFAFINGDHEITEDILYSAIKLVEESGKAFESILSRDRNYVKLAKYIGGNKGELTQVDLTEDLPFYKGGEAQKRDLMNLAVAWGYKNNVVIRRAFRDGIEMLQGDCLEETNIDKVIISYSQELAAGYQPDVAPFKDLHKLTTLSGYHYTAHHFIDNYRSSIKAIPGFNLLILDVDSGISMDTAKDLLSEYMALFATTKRHTPDNHRFRIIMPLSHTLKLVPENYSKFMMNVFNWLPFEVDEATKDISRKWMAYSGTYDYQDGKLLNALTFIPETSKEEEYKKLISDTSNLNNLERWFYTNTDNGNRSNQMIKYAYALVDKGLALEDIKNALYSFNHKIKDGLTETEINSTILISTAKSIAKRDA